jgi:hypothetical protein
VTRFLRAHGRRRTSGARALAAAAAAGVLLTGCEPGQLGTAVSVGEESLSISALQEQAGTLLEDVGAPDEAGQAAQVLAATFFVRSQLIEEAATQRGITVSAGDVAEFRAEVQNTQLGQQLQQDALNSGVPADDFDRYLRNALYSQRLAEELSGGDAGESVDFGSVLTDVAQANPVSVNPRYGTWNAEGFLIEADGGQLSTDLDAGGDVGTPTQ